MIETYIGKCCREWPLAKGYPVGRCGLCNERPTYLREDVKADACPLCGNDMQGNPVPEEYRVHKDDCAEQKTRYGGRCFCFPYGEETTHFSNKIGHEVSGFHDGIAFWSDPSGCGRAWPRQFGDSSRDARAKAFADEYNASLEERVA